MPVPNVQAEDANPIGWHGTLKLEFASHQGATQLIHNQAQAPLKVQRPFYPEGPAVCHGVVLHTAGGMVGGERLFSKHSPLSPCSCFNHNGCCR